MISSLPRIAIAVRDFDAAMRVFEQGFGMPVRDLSHLTAESLGAHVGMAMPAGGSMIELMAPADDSAPLAVALNKLLDRRGDGLYALMLEAPSPNDAANALAARGVDVLPLMPGAGGRDIHPRSTHGVLIRVYPDGSVVRPDDLEPSQLGLSGIMRAVVATNDVHAAHKAYGFGLGLQASNPVLDEERGVLVSVVTPPRGATIELVQPIDAEREFAHCIGAFLEAGGKGMYALVLHADDPTSARATLAGRGFSVGHDGSILGTRFLLSAR